MYLNPYQPQFLPQIQVPQPPTQGYPGLSRTLFNISLQEMEHMGLLHNEVADIIKRYREEHGDPPQDMLAVYNYLHEEQIEKAAEVKSLQTMYKE